MGPLSVPALGAPCQVWGQQGWRCLQGVLPWLPPPFPLSLQFLHGLSVCLAIFGTPSSCRRGDSVGRILLGLAASLGTNGVALCPPKAVATPP